MNDYAENRKRDLEEFKISQGIRLFDLLVFSPILIYIGIRGKVNDVSRVALLVLALVSIIYNAYYYEITNINSEKNNNLKK
ncbi:MAG: hypothetical protein KatS3mg096_601 [Candidatus Parcubacteria bacterium]|nr:MAG: hypothetical protein KatS3mg096_601 [Candidatus Parcubacteria bacterium]